MQPVAKKNKQTFFLSALKPSQSPFPSPDPTLCSSWLPLSPLPNHSIHQAFTCFHTIIIKCAIGVFFLFFLNVRKYVEPATQRGVRAWPRHASSQRSRVLLNSPVASLIRVPDFFTFTFVLACIHAHIRECACNIFDTFTYPRPPPPAHTHTHTHIHTQNKQYRYTDRQAAAASVHVRPGRVIKRLKETIRS